MKRFVLAPLVFAAALVAGSADAQDSAQSYGYQDRYGDTYQDGYLADDRYYDDRYGDRYEDRYDDRYEDRYDDRYGYARTATPDRYGRDGTYDVTVTAGERVVATFVGRSREVGGPLSDQA